MLFKNEKPPTSKDEAQARGVRPPPEKYDPDKISHWSITMTVAWIIWREIGAVRNEWDNYREMCADWHYENPSSERLAKRIADNEGTDLARRYPDLQEKLQKKLEKLLEAERKGEQPAWHLHQWKPSAWRGLLLRAISENPPLQDAIESLWLAAGEGRIKATALECKNANALVGDRIEIPAHHWPHLKRADDRLTGKAMLSDDNGMVYREVLFPKFDVKELWPKPVCSPNVEPSVSEEKDEGPVAGSSQPESTEEAALEPEGASEATAPKKRGRKKGNGSYAMIDLPLLSEMKELILSRQAASPEEASRMLAEKAFGSGSLESKAERLAKRYRKNAGGPNSLGSSS